ncbi:plastocyanin/azurin family copper-binding protein [Stappia sp. ICDLI1TA098]
MPTRLTLLLVLLATQAFAETHEVKMLDRNRTGAMPFEPDYIFVQPGETVRFAAASPGHNAATIDGMIPEGATTFV